MCNRTYRFCIFSTSVIADKDVYQHGQETFLEDI